MLKIIAKVIAKRVILDIFKIKKEEHKPKPKPIPKSIKTDDTKSVT